MRKIFSAFSIAIFTLIALIPTDIALASQQSSVVWFEIIAPSTARQWEAIDVTVRAIDRNRQKVDNYRGSIIFISDTFWDTVPSPSKSISFTAEDMGEKKFSKGVVFRSTGRQKIYVADINNSSDLIGETTVMVEAAAPSWSSNNTEESVIVVTPVQNSKIATSTVVVSGKTRKNSTVSFVLNGKDAWTAIVNDEWLFTKTLSGISQEKNLLRVSLLDGANAVIAQSEEILFDRVQEATGFYNIVVTPGTTVETSAPISILVEGDAWLGSVSVSLDGSSITLSEKEAGKYVSDTVAPIRAGIYALSVSMVTSLWQTIERNDVASLTVIEPERVVLVPRFTDIRSTVDWRRITFEFGVENPPATLDAFKIAYGESASSLTEEVTTFTHTRIQWTGWLYTWYIDNLEPRSYVFRIFWLQANAVLIPEFVSGPVSATIGISWSAVANIASVSVRSEPWKSILSWESVACAESYNVYRISAAGEYTLVQNVQDPTYTIFLSGSTVSHSDFAIKALCTGGVESPEYTQVSAVKTWPEIIALLLFISGILGVLILRKRSIV